MTVDFYSTFRIANRVVYLQLCLVVTWLVPRETAAVLGHVVWTPYNHALCRVPAHRVHACFAVTCHLHLWHSDQDLVRATVLTRGGRNRVDLLFKDHPDQRPTPLLHFNFTHPPILSALLLILSASRFLITDFGPLDLTLPL